jgi:hypothetical protein
MAEAAHAKTRGSQKLLEHLSRNGEAPSIDEIRKAVALPSTVDYKILNWLIRGVPPAYLELDATLQVSTVHLAEVVNRFVSLNDSAIKLEIFIHGIPVPELANVRVQNTFGTE